MRDFHFLRPAWFLALPLIVLFLMLLWRWRNGSARWAAVCDPALLPHLLLSRGSGQRRLPVGLLALAWSLAVVALAGPVWERQPQPVMRSADARVVVLDLSPSMDLQDLKPSRIERARFKLRDILAYSREGRTGLVVFGDEAHVVTPLTDDTATILAMLPALAVDVMPAAGDRAALALQVAADLVTRASPSGGEILLISDGFADAADSLNAVHEMRNQGIRVSVLGVAAAGAVAARDEGAPSAETNKALLAQLARAGGGEFAWLQADDSDIRRLVTAGDGLDMRSSETQERGVDRWVERGVWLVLPLLFLAAAGFRRGWLLSVVCLLPLAPQPAQAFEWTDLWSRPDQRAARILDQGNPARAAALFENPRWRSIANYEAGDYAAAAEGFSGGDDADVAYNRGNALARDGRLQEALAAYDQALEKIPEDEDTRFNRALVQRLLDQQQQQGESGDEESPREQQSGDAESGNPSSDASPRAGQDTENPSAADESNPNRSDSQRGDDPEPAGERSDDLPQGEAGQEKQADPAGRREAPQSADASQSDGQDQAGQREAKTDPGGNPDDGQPVTEQELALEQWLRQVPDDPGGLLRRKFMLEHYLRQKKRK